MSPKSIIKTFGVLGVFVAVLAFISNNTNHPVSASETNTIQLPTANLPLQLNNSSSTPLTTPKSVSRVKTNPERTLLLYGEVSGDNSAYLADQIKSLSYKSQEPIYLLINSPGGSVLDGALVISAMEASQAPVNTVCLQICASMAAIIHQYGKTRMMVDRSVLMFHDAAGQLRGTLPQMNTRLNWITRYVSKLNAGLAARAGMSLEEYNSRIAYERWLDAEDATNLRINDTIVSVTVPDNTLKTDSSTNKLKQTIDLDWK